MPDITVIRNAHTVVAFNAATSGHAYLNDADVAFDDSGFLHVGGRYDGSFTHEISGRDRMVLPGFVNVHCHSGEEPISKSLFEDQGTAALWGQAMYEYSTLIEISDDAVQAALTVMLGDLLRSGVTTFVDIAGPHECWLPTLAESGARAYVAPGFREAAWHVEGSHRLDFRWDAVRGREALRVRWKRSMRPRPTRPAVSAASSPPRRSRPARRNCCRKPPKPRATARCRSPSMPPRPWPSMRNCCAATE